MMVVEFDGKLSPMDVFPAIAVSSKAKLFATARSCVVGCASTDCDISSDSIESSMFLLNLQPLSS